MNKQQFRRKQAAILRMHSHLKQKYPMHFSKPYCPFAIRIHEQLFDLGIYDSKLLKIHLKNITHHPLYYLNFLDENVCFRFNLDGSISESIQETERVYARECLTVVMENSEARYRKKLGDEKVDLIMRVLG